MRRALLLVVSVLGALVVLAAAGAGVTFALQPTSFRIVRSRTVAAPAPAIHALVSDLRRFESVGPHLGPPPTPGRTYTFSPVTSGPGAWVDVSEDGRVERLQIIAVTDERIDLEAPNVDAPARFSIELHPVAAGTEVSLVLANELHGLGRALWPFVNLEGRVGPNMEDTLVRIERAVVP